MCRLAPQLVQAQRHLCTFSDPSGPVVPSSKQLPELDSLYENIKSKVNLKHESRSKARYQIGYSCTKFRALRGLFQPWTLNNGHLVTYQPQQPKLSCRYLHNESTVCISIKSHNFAKQYAWHNQIKVIWDRVGPETLINLSSAISLFKNSCFKLL